MRQGSWIPDKDPQGRPRHTLALGSHQSLVNVCVNCISQTSLKMHFALYTLHVWHA